MQDGPPPLSEQPGGCQTFDDWLATPLGCYVMAREQMIFDHALPDLFGFYALQMGCAAVPLMQTSRVTHRFTLAWDTTASLLSEPDQLPFAENQFDVIVLPHTLEFQALPHEVLREVFRVLRPEGRLLISGFNPYSLFGIKRYFGRDRDGPWGGEFMSLSRAAASSTPTTCLRRMNAHYGVCPGWKVVASAGGHSLVACTSCMR